MSENVVIKKDRTVTVPASEAKIGVQYDHNVNVITFDCPRYPDDDRNVDMSTMQIYINYMLPDKTLGSYLAENVKVDTNNPDTIHFDWKITRNVTQVKGALQALVCIKKVDAEGNELYHWNTDLIQSFRVGEGMECLETISSDYADVISQLLMNMNTVVGEFEALSADVTARTSEEALQGLVNNAASDEKLGSIVNAYMEANPVGINIDDTLTVSGDAADAKITGDRISELKSDITNVDFRLSDVFDKVYDSIAVNMINPSNFIVGTLDAQGEAKENSSSIFFVTDYIPVENGKTYALTYYNVNFQTRYPLVPNRLVFYNSSKEFVNQSTDYADNDAFATVRVDISGNTGYAKLTAKQSGYVRMQVGMNLEKLMMANGDVIEWTDVYREQESFAYTLKKGIIDEDNLADELKEKIEGGSIGALDTVYKLAFCKVHKKTLHIGDSLTEGYHASDDIRKSMSYPSHMASLAGYDVTNKGHSGITAYDWWNTYKNIDFTGYDAVFIYLGTNGGLTDTIDADTASGDYTTFASTNTGGYCAIVSKIRDVNPKAKIYIIQYNQTTATSQVTAKIAQKYECTTLMVTDTSVFNLTDSKFHTDPTHYNTIGYWAFACVMLTQLEKYIAEHISEYTDLVGTGEIIRP